MNVMEHPFLARRRKAIAEARMRREAARLYIERRRNPAPGDPEHEAGIQALLDYIVQLEQENAQLRLAAQLNHDTIRDMQR